MYTIWATPSVPMPPDSAFFHIFRQHTHYRAIANCNRADRRSITAWRRRRYRRKLVVSQPYWYSPYWVYMHHIFKVPTIEKHSKDSHAIYRPPATRPRRHLATKTTKAHGESLKLRLNPRSSSVAVISWIIEASGWHIPTQFFQNSPYDVSTFVFIGIVYDDIITAPPIAFSHIHISSIHAIMYRLVQIMYIHHIRAYLKMPWCPFVRAPPIFFARKNRLAVYLSVQSEWLGAGHW